MAGKDIAYTTRNGETFDGYLAEPDGGGQAPGLLLITAIFGIDDEMKELSDAWAKDGFLVSVPDIFWRVMPGPTADMEKAFARYGAFDQEQGMLDIEDLVKDLKARPQCNGKVAMLGICFGGLYAHLGAAAARDRRRRFVPRHEDRRGTGRNAEDRVPRQLPFRPTRTRWCRWTRWPPSREAYAGRDNAEIVVHPGATHNFAIALQGGLSGRRGDGVARGGAEVLPIDVGTDLRRGARAESPA